MPSEAEIERMVVRLTGDASSFRQMMREASMMTERLGDKAVRLGKTLTASVTVPLAAVGVASVKAFADFDDAMTKSTSIMEVTADQTKEMRDLALELSTQGVQGPDQLAESYFFLASAGLDAKQSMEALPVVQQFATAGAFDMAQATDLLTDANSALGRSTKELIGLSDALVKANTLANASVQQFSEAIGKDAGATMKNFNIEMTDGVAVLAAYADQSIKGQDAGGMFGRMVRLLTGAARENSEAFKEMGISVFDSQGELRDFADIIGDMEKALGDLSPEAKGAALEQLGFAQLTQKSILPLIGASDKIREYKNGLQEAGGVTEEVANNQLQSFSSQMKILKNQLTVLAVEIGESLAPTVRNMAEGVKNLIGRWNGLSSEQKESIVRFAAIAAAAGPVLIVLGSMAKALAVLRIALIKTGIGAIVVLLGTLAAKFLSTEEGVRKLNRILEPFQEIWGQLKDLWSELRPQLEELAQAVGGLLVNAFEALSPVIKSVIGIVGNLLEITIKVTTQITKVIGKAVEGWKKVGSAVKDAFTESREEAQQLNKDLRSFAEENPDNFFGIMAKEQLEKREAAGVGRPNQGRVFEQFMEVAQPAIDAAGGNIGEELSQIKLNQGLKEAKEKQMELNKAKQDAVPTNQKMIEVTDAEKERLKELSKEIDKQMEKRKQQQKAVEDTIKSLRTELETFGKSRKEMALLKAEQNGATQAQMDTISSLHDQINAKENSAEATKEAREAEERFQASIKGFGVEGVGRGIEAMERIAQSRRMRATGRGTGFGSNPTPNSDPTMNVAEKQGPFGMPVSEMVKQLEQINNNTRTTAEKESVEIKPANVGSETG